MLVPCLDRGVIAYSPYRLEVPDLPVDSSTTTRRPLEPAWTYEYRFRPQRALKSRLQSFLWDIVCSERLV